MSSDCIFCKIANEEMDADIVYQDREMVVFKDIHPAAPIHLLLVPRKHIPTLLDLQEGDIGLFARLQLVANDLARAYKLDKGGFRMVINCGKDAGQVVYHLHLHLLGGKQLTDGIAKSRGI